MSNYQQDLDEQQRELAAKQFENDCEQGWLQVQRNYPNFAGHDANYKEVKEYCYPFPISLGAFKLMLDNPHAAASLDFKDGWLLEDTKETIREIIRLLREHGRYTEFDLKNEEKKLGIIARQSGGRDNIKSRLAEVMEKQRLAGMSVGAIKQELEAARPQPQVKVLPAEITALTIKALPPSEIRKLIRQWGPTVVNNRLFGRS